MKLYESYKKNKAFLKKKIFEEQIINIYSQLEQELESILYESLIKGGKDSVVIGVRGIEPKYFIDIIAEYNSDLYEFEQISLDKYKFKLKKIV